MEKEGITFRLNENINTKRAADALLKKYDAVHPVLRCVETRDMDVEGRDADGILFCRGFSDLHDEGASGHPIWRREHISPRRAKNVVIVGSGDTANDCVGTAIRHGAKSVLQMQRHGRPPEKRAESNPWPEYPNICKTDLRSGGSDRSLRKDPRLYGATVNRFIRGRGRKTHRRRRSSAWRA